METQLIVAIVSASGAVIAALIAGGLILFAAKRVVDRKKLRVDLTVALNDIQFLLEVEKAHAEVSISVNNKCNKVMMRDVVRREKGIELSGKNTLSAIKRKVAMLSTVDD